MKAVCSEFSLSKQQKVLNLISGYFKDIQKKLSALHAGAMEEYQPHRFLILPPETIQIVFVTHAAE